MSAAPSDPEPIIDVAIVGAGVSGAYSAYRLLSADPGESATLAALLARSGKDRLDVQVFEGSHRIGGRLWSHQFPEIPGLVADLGGQGFSMTQQSVYFLCQALGLPICLFPPYNSLDIQYLRRGHFSPETYDNKYAYPLAVRFFVDDDQKQSPPALFSSTAFELIEGLKEAYTAALEVAETGDLDATAEAANALTAFLREARITVRGSEGARPIWEHGLWNAMLPALDIEGYNMVLNSSFVQAFFGNFNLYDQLLSWFVGSLFTALPDGNGAYFHLPAGYQTLPETLLARVRVAPRFDHRLRNLEKVETEGGSLVRLTFTQGATEVTVLARNVILAMPRRALELLDPHNVLCTSPLFRRDVGAVFSDPITKIFTVYHHAWWTKPNEPDQLMTGYSITDYPLRACYYTGKAANGGGLLNASFADANSTRYWAGLAFGRRCGTSPPSPFQWYGGEDVPGAVDPLLPIQFQLTPELRDEVHRQLVLLHQRLVPPSIDGAYVNWGMNPYGGAAHSWYPGLESWKVIPQIRKPVDGCNIFICGEAYSASQGWCEGAINTAETLVEDYFGLTRPGWVTPHYSFGP